MVLSFRDVRALSPTVRKCGIGFYGFENENIMDVEFMCGLLANYSKELSEAETYREKGDVQLKHAKLILDKVKNCSISAVVERSEQYCEHAVTDQKTLRCTCCEECGEILDVLD